MTTPPTPLDNLRSIEQQIEKANNDKPIICDSCGHETVNWIVCPRCNKFKCLSHIDLARGVCDTCKTSMGAENKTYLDSMVKKEENIK